MSRQGTDNYLGNVNIKKDGVSQEWNKEEILEYQKCMRDSSYFVENYVKIIHLDQGLVPFHPYPYQKDMFQTFEDNRFVCVLACRQSGKSISACAYLLWYVLFHAEKTIAILANKGDTAREMLSRIYLMLENVPFFLQPGCKVLNRGSVEFSNTSKIVARATSSGSVRGLSVNLLYLDEFAFVERSNEFYTSTYPVISSGKNSKVIITSTANGLGNTFHKIWEGALQGTNTFKPFRVDWWDVPGRDEKWKEETVNNTSQLQFDQEFGNTFFGTGHTLINADTLMGMRASQPVDILEGGSLLIYEQTQKNHNYVITVDVSKGRGQDYSTLCVFDISAEPFKQVASYRDNLISPLLFPNIIYKIAKSYNRAFVVVESNDQGGIVCNGLYHDLEYDNLFMSSLTKHDGIGVEITRKTKRIGCTAIKELLENQKLHIVDENTIIECSTFVERRNSWEASDGNHDDLMMNLVMFGYFVSTRMFNDLTDIDLKSLIYDEEIKKIDDDVLPFGYDNGLNNDIDYEEESKKGVQVVDWTF